MEDLLYKDYVEVISPVTKDDDGGLARRLARPALANENKDPLTRDLVGRPGLDPGTLGLKEDSDQYLWSSDVGKVPNKRKTRLLMSAWFDGIRLVRGMNGGIKEEPLSTKSLPNVSSQSPQSRSEFAASQRDQHGPAAKRFDQSSLLFSHSEVVENHRQLPIQNLISSLAVVDVQKLLLTIPEVCGVLAISRTKVYDLLNSGALPSVYIGRSRRIRVSDVDNFVKNRTP